MPEHRLLTGNQLHEPKGIESASVGTVYVADGTGSGAWLDPFADLYNINKFSGQQIVENGSAFFIPNLTGVIKEFGLCIIGPSGANETFSLYINGNLATPTTGAVPSSATTRSIYRVSLPTGIPIDPNSVIEVRYSDTLTIGNFGFISIELTG